MTSSRKQQIEKLLVKVGAIKDDIIELMREEKESLEDLPPTGEFFASKSEEKITQAIDNLEGAVESIKDVEDYLKYAISKGRNVNGQGN